MWTTALQFSLIIQFISLFLIIGTDVIGDGLSSKSSNQEFFSSMDTNLDGTVEESEVRQIVSAFGGGSLDEPDEIKRSVKNVFAQLDTNQDGTLTVAESHTFWRHLGALLSVNEVAEWVVHGIQMPQSVGDIFRANAVSGYDFAELLEDDGAAIEELGITRSVHKKKLLRSIRMLMSGVGILPTAPANASVEGISCHSAKVSWSASDGGGFPVHKYRVYRHSLGSGGKLKRNSSEKGEVVASDAESSTESQEYRGDWLLVYEGPSPSFIDTGLLSGVRYEYQCEAWSLFGHSGMSSFSGYSWDIDKGTSSPCVNSHETLLKKQVTLRSPTSMPPSTPLTVTPLPPAATWHHMPWSQPPLIDAAYALPPPPINMSTAFMTEGRASLFSLAGVKQLLEDGIYGLWCIIALLWGPLAFLVTSLSPIFGLLTALMRIRRGSMNHKSDVADRVHAGITWRVLAFLAAIIPGAAYLIPKSLRSDPDLYDVSVKSDGSASPAALGTSGVRHVRPPEMGRYRPSSIRKQLEGSDLSRCEGCNKRFHPLSLASLGGIVRMRPKHTCSSCWSVFCGACGYTSHNRLLTCPVGGGCLCMSCHKKQYSTPLEADPNMRSPTPPLAPCFTSEDEVPSVPLLKLPSRPSFIRSLSRSASLSTIESYAEKESRLQSRSDSEPVKTDQVVNEKSGALKSVNPKKLIQNSVQKIRQKQKIQNV